MCGIVGAVGDLGSETGLVSGLVEGLRVLEYRGYDSAGVAVEVDGALATCCCAGRLVNLEESLAAGRLVPLGAAGDGGGDAIGGASGDAAGAAAGIGHTRWATHGPPTDGNAHPHVDSARSVAVVHNGIIENYAALRGELEAVGVRLASDTDTEVLAHMVGRRLGAGSTLLDAVCETLGEARGYYAVAFVAPGAPGRIVCARKGPPLALTSWQAAGGRGAGAYLASDVLGLLPHGCEIVYLEDGDVAVLEAGRAEVYGLDGQPRERVPRLVEWEAEDADLGNWPHYMLKEIHEQPDVLAKTTFERIREEVGDAVFEGNQWSDESLAGIERVQVIACGTALHAGIIGAYMVEELARVPVDVDFASEFRYRDPVLVPGTLALAVSQSGETADTLAALRLAQELGARGGAICNVVGSTLVREVEEVILTHAGPEIGVASTKAFTAQVAAAFLLALRLGRARGALASKTARELLSELRELRPCMERLLSGGLLEEIRATAARYGNSKGFLFLGRGVNYPVALEGALKLKEIAYVHAEGYPAGEMKHGPIALVEPGMTILAINSPGRVAAKVRSNIEQVKARGGEVISVGADAASHAIADAVLAVPECPELLSPLLNVLPLQLFAYEVARLKGCDIDKPRNLAKSVTVE
ncbi:MAG TPA: glutamine--fructose-6-phosphate transaminase (isomerizing) [Planctomycetota bacterium]|nr:glutamine--fructose-6-phosphate transaminase (isomerizing) [Planctomycetota bacterium]